MNRIMVATLLALTVALLGGCEHAPGAPPNPVVRPSEVNDFAALYGENCAACHGAKGQNGPAIDLANPEYQALVDDATLRKWISNGMPGTEMAAFAQSAGGMLTDAQVTTLIAGMRREWLQPNVASGARPPPYGLQQAGDPHRGQESYQTRCAACHDGSQQQITSPVYLSLIGDQALRSFIIAGRPDIGQPDWQHDGPGGKADRPLSTQEVDDIVTYLSSLRSAAPGQGALPTQSER
jgi:cytochrome c oxidase cbb3-type subunit 3